jgi:hypothetical protein
MDVTDQNTKWVSHRFRQPIPGVSLDTTPRGKSNQFIQAVTDTPKTWSASAFDVVASILSKV